MLGADHPETLDTRKTLDQVLADRARHQRDRTLDAVAVVVLASGLLVFTAWYFFLR
jgi:hypothetical protein